MGKKENKINKMIQEIKMEELVKDTLAKIKEITKKNEGKDRAYYCFIVSQEMYLYIVDHKIPVFLRGFKLLWHNGFDGYLFFGKFHMFEGPNSKDMIKKLEERLQGDNK